MSNTTSNLQISNYDDLESIDFSKRASLAIEKSHQRHRNLINRLSKISQETDAVLTRLREEELKRNGDESSK